MHLLSTNDSDSLQIWLKEIKEFQLDSMFDTNVLGRAYLYTKLISIEENNENSVSAIVDDKMYRLKLFFEENAIYGECGCPFDGPCKHLAALLLVSMKND